MPKTPPTKKTAPKKKQPTGGGPKSAKKSKERTPFVSDDGQAAYEHFLPLAKAIPADAKLEVCNAELAVVLANCKSGVAAIADHLDVVRRKAPECPVADVLELPTVAVALLFAGSLVVGPMPSEREIEGVLARVRPMRELTLKQLEVFAGLGLVSAARVKAIRRGSGALDTARDAVAIVALFREQSAELAGKHPFTAAQLDALATDGNWLVQNLQPSNAPRKPAARNPASVVRDQIWALVRKRYDDLLDAAGAVFGVRHVDEHIPPLRSRIAVALASEPAAPTPTEDAKETRAPVAEPA